MICALRNPNLKLRHWKKLSEITKIHQLTEELDISLKDLIDKGILKH